MNDIISCLNRIKAYKQLFVYKKINIILTTEDYQTIDDFILINNIRINKYKLYDFCLEMKKTYALSVIKSCNYYKNNIK